APDGHGVVASAAATADTTAKLIGVQALHSVTGAIVGDMAVVSVRRVVPTSSRAGEVVAGCIGPDRIARRRSTLGEGADPGAFGACGCGAFPVHPRVGEAEPDSGCGVGTEPGRGAESHDAGPPLAPESHRTGARRYVQAALVDSRVVPTREAQCAE